MARVIARLALYYRLVRGVEERAEVVRAAEQQDAEALAHLPDRVFVPVHLRVLTRADIDWASDKNLIAPGADAPQLLRQPH